MTRNCPWLEGIYQHDHTVKIAALQSGTSFKHLTARAVRPRHDRRVSPAGPGCNREVYIPAAERGVRNRLFTWRSTRGAAVLGV